MMLRNYSIGLALSLALTAASFGLAWLYLGGAAIPAAAVAGLIVALAIVQLLVQTVFFLHLGGEWKAWNIIALLFSVLIIVFVVGGSLWIMAHLKHNTGHGQKFMGEISPYTQHD